MPNKLNTNVDRIIAKIDNDFNPDNSDWIPRVGAWAIDVMNMLKVTPTERKKIKVPVVDRIAMTNCPIDNIHIKIYDANGCEVKSATDVQCSCGCPSTGEESEGAEQSGADITNTTSVVYNENAIDESNAAHAETVNSHDINSRYNVINYSTSPKNNFIKNYVIVDCNTIELNWDTDYICIEQEVVKTQKSGTYGCELPVIPNNGLLIEAIVYYCMYKMLCRGYKHPVFNLAASQYGTNPYYMWTQLKDQAERSVIIDAQGKVIEDGNLWQSAFFVNTFNPRK